MSIKAADTSPILLIVPDVYSTDLGAEGSGICRIHRHRAKIDVCLNCRRILLTVATSASIARLKNQVQMVVSINWRYTV